MLNTKCMKYKIGSSILALLTSIFISYAVTIKVFHTHTNFHQNCPVCHFQLNDSFDIHHTISPTTFSFIKFFQIVPRFSFQQITQESTSRSPPA